MYVTDEKQSYISSKTKQYNVHATSYISLNSQLQL